MNKNFIFSTLACLSFIIGKSQTSEIFKTSEGAIHGYDPVSYFAEKKAVKGNETFHYTWKGANWYFSSKVNLDSFRIHPEKYEPQFGGYCAYGMAEGHKASTDPQSWTILDGKLYLNYNKEVLNQWKKDQSTNIIKADRNWPLLKNKDE
jgi:YHS domain-containing protein